MVRICEANASTASELKAAPFSNEYQKFLLGSSMTKFTTNSAYSTRSQVMVAHTIPQLSWMNHIVRFPAAWPMWVLPTITPAARLPASTSAPAESSGWCCSISRSRWFEDCILPYESKQDLGLLFLFPQKRPKTIKIYISASTLDFYSFYYTLCFVSQTVNNK